MKVPTFYASVGDGVIGRRGCQPLANGDQMRKGGGDGLQPSPVMLDAGLMVRNVGLHPGDLRVDDAQLRAPHCGRPVAL